MQRKTSRRSKNSDTTQTKVYKLIQLKKKQDKLALEMQKLKDELYQEILKAPKNKLICSEGNVALNTSRSWSLLPLTLSKLRKYSVIRLPSTSKRNSAMELSNWPKTKSMMKTMNWDKSFKL